MCLLIIVGILLVRPRMLRAPQDESRRESLHGESSLTDGTWELNKIGEDHVSSEMKGQLTFSLHEDGSLNGKFCNTFSGTYRVDTNDFLTGTIASTDIISTKMSCHDSSMTAEQALFEGLKIGVGYRITGWEMWVTTDSGITLEFNKQIE